MLLPRLARLLRQCPSLLSRPPCIHPSPTAKRLYSTSKNNVVLSGKQEIDESFLPLLDSMHLRPSRSNRTRASTVRHHQTLEEDTAVSVDEGEGEGSGLFQQELGTLYEQDMQQGEEAVREERRSPAAVLGSKRIGLVVLPERLVDGIQAKINESDPHEIRTSFLQLNPTTSSSISKQRNRYSEADQRHRSSPIAALAKAAAFLPGEYAAVRNVLREMSLRLGEGRFRHDLMEVSGSLGAGAWAMADIVGALNDIRPEGQEESERPAGEEREGQTEIKYHFIHPGRAGIALATELFQTISDPSLSIETCRKLSPSLVQVDDTHASPQRTAIAMSTFHLSTLPTRATRLAHLRSLLSLDPEHIVLVDRSTRSGWDAISEARAFILGLDQHSQPSTLRPSSAAQSMVNDGQSGSDQRQAYHVLAPCPHDGVCPMTTSSSRDICSFSQRLQRPPFLRRTKHTQRGEEDMGYTYVVLSRGARPSIASNAHESSESASGNSRSNADADKLERDTLDTSPVMNGRIGGVGREEQEKARNKVKGKSVLREVEGGEYEMVPLADELTIESGMVETGGDEDARATRVDDDELRREAYTWPRVVAPPIKRSGHVVMDVCSPNGTLQRQTFAKSHSKQGYHDARKAAWGDLFPHTPKTRPIERERGIRKLAKPMADLSGVGTDKETGVDEVDEETMKRWPVAELVNDPEAQEVTTWRSGGAFASDTTANRVSEKGKRGMSTWTAIGRSRSDRKDGKGMRRFTSSAWVKSVHPPEQPSTSIPGSTSSTSTPAPSPRPKVTIANLYGLMRSGTPVTCLTAYDYPTALLSQHAEIDMVLIGDSLAQVCLGHDTTTRITLDEMIHHAKAVTRGAKTPFVFADLPFGSFEVSEEQGVKSVIRLIKEGGVDGVKIEGGREILGLVRKLSSMGIAVMPHVGLQPQRATSLSGYKVQAKSAESAIDLYNLCRDFQAAGAFALLIEAVPFPVAEYITKQLEILTIGIGGGQGTAGQVLVITDVLGTYAGQGEWKAKFVRHFGEQRTRDRESVEAFREAVRGGAFPTREESYGMKKGEWEGFLRGIESEDSAG